MKENIWFSCKCLFSFSTRPAVDVMGEKCCPPTSLSINMPITFIALTALEKIQGDHHRDMLGPIFLLSWVYQGRILGLRLWVLFFSASGLDLLSGTGSGQLLWNPVYGKHWPQAISLSNLLACSGPAMTYLRLLKLFLCFPFCEFPFLESGEQMWWEKWPDSSLDLQCSCWSRRSCHCYLFGLCSSKEEKETIHLSGLWRRIERKMRS